MKEDEYKTISSAIRGLKSKGFTQEFRINLEDNLETQNGELYSPNQICVVETHHFELPNIQRGYATVYAIMTDGGEKGLLIDAYGTRGGVKIASFLRKAAQPLE